jgi:hypothetical protein
VDESGTDSELQGIELALVRVAIEISDRYDYETALARPVTEQSLEDAIAVIAEQGSPPLLESVARDLAANARFTNEELKPLLAATLTEGIAARPETLEARLNELRKAGPTVDRSGFPPDRETPEA